MMNLKQMTHFQTTVVRWGEAHLQIIVQLQKSKTVEIRNTSERLVIDILNEILVKAWFKK